MHVYLVEIASFHASVRWTILWQPFPHKTILLEMLVLFLHIPLLPRRFCTVFSRFFSHVMVKETKGVTDIKSCLLSIQRTHRQQSTHSETLTHTNKHSNKYTHRRKRTNKQTNNIKNVHTSTRAHAQIQTHMHTQALIYMQTHKHTNKQ